MQCIRQQAQHPTTPNITATTHISAMFSNSACPFALCTLCAACCCSLLQTPSNKPLAARCKKKQSVGAVSSNPKAAALLLCESKQNPAQTKATLHYRCPPSPTTTATAASIYMLILLLLLLLTVCMYSLKQPRFCFYCYILLLLVLLTVVCCARVCVRRHRWCNAVGVLVLFACKRMRFVPSRDD
jgi:hypothetical protein